MLRFLGFQGYTARWNPDSPTLKTSKPCFAEGVFLSQTASEAEGRRRLSKVLRDGRLETHLLSLHRMDEPQALGVQPEPAFGDRGPVERVGVNGVADSREVDPDLVRPPGLEPHPEHRVPRRLPQDLEVRDGSLAHAGGH